VQKAARYPIVVGLTTRFECGIPLALPKVLVLASEFPPGPGGIGTHAHQVALHLHAHGWEVEVCAPQDLTMDEAIRAFNRELPFTVHRLSRFGRGPIKLGHRLAVVSGHVRRARPDVLVASGERMVWLGAALHYVHRVPLVAVGHAMEFNRHPRWEYALTRRSFEAALGAVCVSNYTWSRMEGCDIRVRDGAVIPNGADDQLFRLLPEEAAREFRRAHGLEDAAILITVGSVHERKGQDVVIRALPRVLEHVPNAHYVMVGMPYERDRFTALARELGVAHRVHFLGKLDNEQLVQALNAADLFVMASKHTPEGDFEGFGIAVLEAALCGCPAVVSDDSGVVEAIAPGETGLAAVMGDPASTAVQILAILEDTARLDRMGRRARERALGNTWARRGEEYDRLLRRLLKIPSTRDTLGRVNTISSDVH